MARPKLIGVFNFDHRVVVRTWHLAVPDVWQNRPAMVSPDKLTSPSRTCEKCSAEMKHLSDLPSFLGRAAIRIFRCYVCDNVVSEAR
jgi:hypothetical protein